MLLGDHVQRFIPRGLAEAAFAALAHPDQRGRARGRDRRCSSGRTGRARTVARRMRVFRVAFQLDDPPVFHLGEQAAAPDAHLAHAVGCSHRRRRRAAGLAGGLRHEGGTNCPTASAPAAAAPSLENRVSITSSCISLLLPTHHFPACSCDACLPGRSGRTGTSVIRANRTTVKKGLRFHRSGMTTLPKLAIFEICGKT